MADVTAIVWALFGLMVAMLGVLATAVFTAINRVDGLRAEMNAGFSDLRGDFGLLRGEFGVLRGEFGVLRGEFSDLRGEVRDLRSDVVSLDRRLNAAGG